MTERRTGVNYLELARLSPEIGQILAKAGEIARQYNRPGLSTRNVFLALLRDKSSMTYQVLVDLGANIGQLKGDLGKTQREREIFQYRKYKEGRMSHRLRKVVRDAIESAGRIGIDHNRIGEVHLVTALLNNQGLVPFLLEESGIHPWVFSQTIHNSLQEQI